MKTVLLALGAMLAMGASTLAQDVPSVDVTVGEKPYTLPLKADELGILYLDEVTVTNDGQFANAIVFLNTTEGWTQLVPCTNEMVSCARIPMRVEGAFQGQSFTFEEFTGPDSVAPIEEGE